MEFVETPVCRNRQNSSQSDPGSSQWKPAPNIEVNHLAQWSIQQLPTLSGFEGEYTYRTFKNAIKKIDNGNYYKFQLDVVHRDKKGKYAVIIH